MEPSWLGSNSNNTLNDAVSSALFSFNANLDPKFPLPDYNQQRNSQYDERYPPRNNEDSRYPPRQNEDGRYPPRQNEDDRYYSRHNETDRRPPRHHEMIDIHLIKTTIIRFTKEKLWRI